MAKVCPTSFQGWKEKPQSSKESSQQDHRPSGSLLLLVLSVSFGGGAPLHCASPATIPGGLEAPPCSEALITGIQLPRSRCCCGAQPLSPPAPSPRVGMGLPRPAPSGSQCCLISVLCPQSTNPFLEPNTSNKKSSKPVSSSTVTAFSWQLFWSDPFILPWGHSREQKECQLVHEHLAHAEEMVATSLPFVPTLQSLLGLALLPEEPPTPLCWLCSLLLPCHPLIIIALALLGCTCTKPLLVAQGDPGGGRKEK